METQRKLCYRSEHNKTLSNICFFSRFYNYVSGILLFCLLVVASPICPSNICTRPRTCPEQATCVSLLRFCPSKRRQGIVVEARQGFAFVQCEEDQDEEGGAPGDALRVYCSSEDIIVLSGSGGGGEGEGGASPALAVGDELEFDVKMERQKPRATRAVRLAKGTIPVSTVTEAWFTGLLLGPLAAPPGGAQPKSAPQSMKQGPTGRRAGGDRAEREAERAAQLRLCGTLALLGEEGQNEGPASGADNNNNNNNNNRRRSAGLFGQEREGTKRRPSKAEEREGSAGGGELGGLNLEDLEKVHFSVRSLKAAHSKASGGGSRHLAALFSGDLLRFRVKTSGRMGRRSAVQAELVKPAAAGRLRGIVKTVRHQQGGAFAFVQCETMPDDVSGKRPFAPNCFSCFSCFACLTRTVVDCG